MGIRTNSVAINIQFSMLNLKSRANANGGGSPCSTRDVLNMRDEVVRFLEGRDRLESVNTSES